MKAKSKTNANVSANHKALLAAEHYKDDCRKLRAGELAQKYKLTYDSYRSVKQRAKKEGIPLDQRLSQFRTFLLSIGPRTDRKFTLDRIDYNGPYSPENCRWADKQTQTLNRSNAVKLTYNGLTLPLKVWAHRLHVEPDVLYQRRSSGWSDEEIIMGRRAKSWTYGTPWPEGEEVKWERAYKENREDGELRERFYLRACKRRLAYLTEKMKPYKEYLDEPVPASLGAAYVAAQRALQSALNKVRDMRAAKTPSFFDLLAPKTTYEFAGADDEPSEDDEDGDQGYADEEPE